MRLILAVMEAAQNNTRMGLKRLGSNAKLLLQAIAVAIDHKVNTAYCAGARAKKSSVQTEQDVSLQAAKTPRVLHA